MRKIALVFVLSLLLTACDVSETPSNNIDTSPWTISATEASAIMESGEPFWLFDVRTGEEFMSEHIPNAVSLPVNEISPDVVVVFRTTLESIDRDISILVYCRSGNRSATAAHMLSDMGFTKVYDFGGIIDWPFGTVTPVN